MRHSQQMQCLIPKVWHSSWLTTFIKNQTFFSDSSSSPSYLFPPRSLITICSNEIRLVRSLMEPRPKIHFSSSNYLGLSPLQMRRLLRIATEQVFLGRFLAKYSLILAASQYFSPLGPYIGSKLFKFVLGNSNSLTFIPKKNALAFFFILLIVVSDIFEKKVAIQMTSFSMSIWLRSLDAKRPKPCPSYSFSQRLSPGCGALIGSKSSRMARRDFFILHFSPASEPRAAILSSLSGTTKGTTRVLSLRGLIHFFFFGFSSSLTGSFSIQQCKYISEACIWCSCYQERV